MNKEDATAYPLAVYIAGPISRDPEYKEKFAAAEARLKAAGYFAMNPAVLPYPGLPYESYMRISGAMLHECGAIHMLPGWENSPGAVVEYSQAIADAMLFIDDDMSVSRIHKTKPTIEDHKERNMNNLQYLYERGMHEAVEISDENIIPPKPYKRERPDKPDPLKDIMDTLEKGVTDLFESDRYKQYLDTLSKFHSYSLNNTILIAMQKPDATLVAGYNAWQKSFKRFVKKGEKAIKIIAPMPQTVRLNQPELDAAGKPIRDENGQLITHEVERSFVKYRVASVFDVSQTDGQPLPTLIPEIKETPSPSVLGHPFFLTLEKVASPVPIAIDMPPGSKARGMYSSTENKIYIDHRHAESMVFKTLIHEISHARLHSAGPGSIDRQTAEVQAESIAYTVCAHYGLDTSDYSFGYIAGWSSGKDAKELRASLEIIRTEAAAIIERVDEYYPIEYDRWAQEHTQPEVIPEIPAVPDRSDIFSQLLEREDIQFCATIAGKAGCYEDFIKTCDSISSQLATGTYSPAALDKAAADIAAHYPLPENPLRTAELSMEQNENMIDGVLNNAPSPGERAASAPPDFSDLRGVLEDCKREAAACSRPSIGQRLEQFKAQAAERAEALPRRQRKYMEVER